MAQFTLTLTGTTPLVVHNPQLADPENPTVREIKGITSKRKKTDDDHRAVGRLEWQGGLYLGQVRRGLALVDRHDADDVTYFVVVR